VRFVRNNCTEYRVFPDKIGVLGFSAGGHLACTLATNYAYECYPPADDVDKTSARPDAAVLCYAVVSMKNLAPPGSVKALLGGNPAPEVLARLSGEESAHPEMPPVFIWHTVEDMTVPVENALMMAQALRKHGVPFECHLFNTGRHGVGLGYDIPVTNRWSVLCGEWLKQVFGL
jgi:acetyl esterase/lipase